MNIRIYQIDAVKDSKKIKFESLDSTIKYAGKVDPKIYSQVFGGKVDCKTLEEVFAKFNDSEVLGFSGHSMSVSDVVEILDGEKKGTYFCNPVGFKKIDFDSSQISGNSLLKILVVEPNKEPYQLEIQDDYKAMQGIVGGLIEAVYMFHDNALIFCNDEGKIIGLEGNRRIGSTVIAGTFFIVGDGTDGECCSLTDEQIEKYSEMFAKPEQIMQEEVQADMGFTITSFN